jgi:hypothetical protein
MNNLSKIKNLIKFSKLSEIEKKEMIYYLKKIEDTKLSVLLDLFIDDPNMVLEFYQNLKNKKQAIKTKNGELWEEVIKQEEKYLSEI